MCLIFCLVVFCFCVVIFILLYANLFPTKGTKSILREPRFLIEATILLSAEHSVVPNDIGQKIVALFFPLNFLKLQDDNYQCYVVLAGDYIFIYQLCSRQQQSKKILNSDKYNLFSPLTGINCYDTQYVLKLPPTETHSSQLSRLS